MNRVAMPAERPVTPETTESDTGAIGISPPPLEPLGPVRRWSHLVLGVVIGALPYQETYLEPFDTESTSSTASVDLAARFFTNH